MLLSIASLKVIVTEGFNSMPASLLLGYVELTIGAVLSRVIVSEELVTFNVVLSLK